MAYIYYENDLPENLELGDEIAIDTETLGLNNFRDRLCLVQISSGDGMAHLVHFSSKSNYGDAKNLIKLLTNDKILKIFHFARFDLAILQLTFGIKIKNIYCTKVASKIARTYTDAHGLKVLVKEFFDIEISKNEQRSYWGGDEISKKQLEYAANDVLYLHKIKEKLESMLINENRKYLLDECLAFLPTRVELDLKGWLEMDMFSHE